MNQPLHILIVDDDPDDHEIFESAVKNILPTAKCTGASNGQVALETLKTGSSKPDMIFLDLNMPLMNGKQFLVEIKKHPDIEEIPVIVLSTSSDPANVAETMLLGAKSFITKPDKFSQWESALRKLFREQSFLIEER